MIWKDDWLLLSCLIILMIWSLSSVNWAYGQQKDGEICFDKNDAKTILQTMYEAPIMKERLKLSDDQNRNLQDQVNILIKENELRERYRLLSEQEADMYKKAYEREKDLFDKTMKLADEKAKTNWKTTIFGGGMLLFLGLAVGLLL